MRKLSLIVALTLLCGCNALSPPAPQSELVEAGPPNCSELLAEAVECRASAESTHELYQKNKKAFRKKILQTRITQGLELVEGVFAHDEVTPDEVKDARDLKADLLFLAAMNLGPEHAEKLRDFAKRMMVEAEGTSLCEKTVGNWISFKFASPDSEELAAAEKAILGFAKTYSGSSKSTELIERLAVQMLEFGQCSNAATFLNRATSVVSAPGKLDTVKSLVRKTWRTQKEKQNKLAASNQFRQSVKRRIGGRESGYFVLFSRQRKGSRCDYSVCKGLKEVVRYAQSAESRDWTWKVEQRFPETSAGYSQASGKKNSLVKRNTISVPVYGYR